MSKENFERSKIKQKAKNAVKGNFFISGTVYVFVAFLAFLVNRLKNVNIADLTFNIFELLKLATPFLILAVLLNLFFIFPMQVGKYSYYLKLYRGDDAVFKNLFSYFNKKTYARNIRATIISTIPAIVLLGIPLILGNIFLEQIQTNKFISFLFIFLVLINIYYIIEYYFAIMLFKYHLSVSDDGAKKCFLDMIKKSNGHKLELFKCTISFVPWLLLSLVTLGLAYFFVGPYMKTTFAGYYEEIFN